MYRILLLICVLWAGTSTVSAADITLRVMSFNLWHGGDAGGQPLEQTIEVIRRSKADIVGIQELHGAEVNDVREDHGPLIADALGWHYQAQTRRRGIISRFPLAAATSLGHGVEVELVDGQRMHFFNVHFPASPYQPYQLLNIEYGDAPFIKTQKEAIDWANQSRGTHVSEVLQDMIGPLESGLPVILTGDFNEPSCLDWTEKSRLANACPIVVDYPATRRVGNVGMVDTWRVTHPDEVTHPGLTWTPLTPRDDPADHHDRIDFVFASAGSTVIVDCEVMGEHSATADIVVTPWPSDHRSVVATVRIPDNSRARKEPAGRRRLHPSAHANSHAPGEVDHPDMVPFIVRRPESLAGIVLDETEASLQGEWQYSTHTPPWVGLGYLHDRKTNKGGSSITWTPDLPTAGVYEVRVSHCRNFRRASNTPVIIHHADGESVVRIDQQTLPEYDSLFRSVGRYRFEQGKAGWVRISNEGTDGKYVIADAVQFLPE